METVYLNLAECGYVGSLVFHRMTREGPMFECDYLNGQFTYLTFPSAVSAQNYADGHELLYCWDH